MLFDSKNSVNRYGYFIDVQTNITFGGIAVEFIRV